MQQQGQIDDLGLCPSFNCYSSDSLTSTAATATRVTNQLQEEHAARFHDVDAKDFEFSLAISEDIISDGRKVFPVFNRDLLINDDVDHENACTDSLSKLFMNEREESASSSSSEADESEGEASGVFCVWRQKTDAGASPLSKCKKSSSTGSGSKRWRIRDLLRRSNSDGKEPMMLLTHNKKVEIPKEKRNSGEVSIVSGKSTPSVHELFYVQQRAKREGSKRKSYLPYRQGLVGFFSNANGKGQKFPF